MSVTKNKIIDWVTFLINASIAIALVLGGQFLASGLLLKPSQEDIAMGNKFMILGIVLFLFYIYALKKKTLKFYLLSVLLTVSAMVVWIKFEGSSDVAAFLPFYLIIFLPLSFYKYKLHTKIN